jgi:hypothetical protein
MERVLSTQSRKKSRPPRIELYRHGDVPTSPLSVERTRKQKEKTMGDTKNDPGLDPSTDVNWRRSG